MTPDEEMSGFLRESAVTIDQASDDVTRRRYAKFLEACKARTEREVLNQQTDMDGYADARDKDLADYERAERAYAGGDLHAAAEWYRKAAENDFADSALRLANVLERIAEKHLAAPVRRAVSDELSRVVEEASRWNIAAYTVGDIGTDEVVKRLERLMKYLDPTRPVLTIAPSTDSGAGEHEPSRPRPRLESLSFTTTTDEGIRPLNDGPFQISEHANRRGR